MCWAIASVMRLLLAESLGSLVHADRRVVCWDDADVQLLLGLLVPLTIVTSSFSSSSSAILGHLGGHVFTVMLCLLFKWLCKLVVLLSFILITSSQLLHTTVHWSFLTKYSHTRERVCLATLIIFWKWTRSHTVFVLHTLILVRLFLLERKKHLKLQYKRQKLY